MSTATRSLIAFLLVAIATFYLLLDKLTERVERQYMEAVEETMVDTANLLAALAEQHLDESGAFVPATFRTAFDEAGRRTFEARIYSLTKSKVTMGVLVCDREGVVVFDSQEGAAEGENYSQWLDVALTLQGQYGARSTKTDPDDKASSIMHVAAPIRHEEAIVGVLTVTKPQSSVFFFRDETRAQIVRLVLLSLGATGLASILVSIWMSRPVRQLTDYARAVRRGERRAPPKLATPEMRTLGRALEEMRDTLENRKYVESYVQTLTHEMKSPVAAIRGAAELLQEPDVPNDKAERFLSNITGETNRLQHIIDRLLALASIESRKSLESVETLSLTRIVERVCHEYRDAADTRSIRLVTQIAPNCVVEGESFLLEMAVGNLLENALDFSPKGSRIRVTLDTNGDGDETVLTIEDEGPGIPDYALDRVFDRFYSLQHPDTGKKSSGLGLCFVREAAQLHGGQVRLENRHPDPGAKATLRLPLAA